MNKVLITGASGFLGGFLLVAARNYKVLGTSFRHKVFHSHYPITRLDLTDPDEVMQLLNDFRPDCIIHTAANSNLDLCEKDQQAAIAINVNSTEFLAEWSENHDARLIFVSSDMVFDGQQGMYTEKDYTSPNSFYGKTKVASEVVVMQLANGVIIRSALDFGAPALGGTSFLMWMQNRLQKNEKVPLFVDQFRSPVWGQNLADMIVELIDHDFTGIINGGGANRINRFTFGQQLCQAAGFDESLLTAVKMDEQIQVAPRPRDVSLDMSFASSILKTPILTTEEALQKIY